MTGFLVFLVKELTEIRKTWRIWVLPGILITIGFISPVLAEVTPALIESLTGDDPGIVIEIPDPVAADAYLQFFSNLNQIALIALIIVSAGIISSERRRGTAILTLTKPLSRPAMIMAKAIAQALLLVVATALATLVCWLLTLLVFGGSPVAEFLQAVLIWLVLALFFIAATVLFSTLFDSQSGAAGLGLALYLSISILSAWSVGQEYTPAGLFTATTDLINGTNPELVLPVLTGILATVVFLLLAIWIFNRQELTGRTGD